jgi:acyl-CoA thioesterase FadM
MIDGYLLTFSKKITKKYIDHNNHLNIRNYSAFFDDANNFFLNKIGFDFSINQDATFVAGKLLITFKKEVLLNDSIKIFSAITNIDNFNISIVHQMISNNSIKSKCNILASPFSKHKRIKINLTKSQLKKISFYLLDGVEDFF